MMREDEWLQEAHSLHIVQMVIRDARRPISVIMKSSLINDNLI
jgi:hypothetical protein